MPAAALAALLVACGNGGAAFPVPAATAPAPSVVQTTFTPTDAHFANPERGFYQAAGATLENLNARQIAEAFDAGYRLIYVRIDLEAYRNTDLPAAYLTKLDAAFETARRGGVKLIVRATYNYPRGETEYRTAQDASLTRTLGHLAQLKPLLQRNADIIAFVQAGFIGAWGEWHTSSNDLTTSENRTRIRDALLDAVPSTRFIQFRYPPYIQDWTPTLPAVDVALNGNYRVGFHNDCFLASATDVGTFEENATVRAGQQQYIDALGDLTPFGGETCNPADDPNPLPRTTCADIRAEGARYNLTYLNDGYYRRLFHDKWTREGCMTEVRRSLGYRFELIRLSHPVVADRGASLSLSLTVRNTGWARLYNSRPVEIVLRHTATGAVRRLEASGTDPRRWMPGREATENLAVILPGGLPSGAYEVLLALPDADARLGIDPRFAIRLANADDLSKGQVWEETAGAFRSGTKVEIR